MAKKAKWLEESTNGELLDIVKEGYASEDDAAVKKGSKALDELVERTPASDGEVSVEDAISNLDDAVKGVKDAYQAELDALDANEEDEEETEEEEEEVEDDLSSKSKKELIAIAKELGVPNARKKSVEDLVEAIKDAQGEDEDEAEDEEEGADYSELSKAELLAEIKERGLKANRKKPVKDLIAILEADDEEE